MTRAATDPVTPVACPDCHTDQIKGPDQPSTGLSYWRCLKCGVIWNPERPPDRGRDHRPERSKQRNRAGDYWHDK
jgi:rubredoxin